MKVKVSSSPDEVDPYPVTRSRLVNGIQGRLDKRIQRSDHSLTECQWLGLPPLELQMSWTSHESD